MERPFVRQIGYRKWTAPCISSVRRFLNSASRWRGWSTDEKSNEIPAVQELLKALHIEGQMITADAMNCQKETAKIIVEQKADYLLCAKDNQPALKKDERAEQRVALLYKQSGLKCERTVASCAHGMVGRNDALAVGRILKKIGAG